jgi:pyrophosphate--fructose-6-phosphate 1-phosphotransferase
VADGVTILHTIGGDDTNTTAADLAHYLHEHDYELTVVGLPKTIDNDVIPIQQSLGADTAAEMGARLRPERPGRAQRQWSRMLIVHEVMGRNCGWLTAATARKYRDWLDRADLAARDRPRQRAWDVHGLYVPEAVIDIAAEAERLTAVMDEVGCVNLFISEGAGVESIVAEMEAAGEEVARDAFGHIRLDKVNPGAWFGKQFAEMLGAEKTLVQKSGYYSPLGCLQRVRPRADRHQMADLAVDAALRGEPGVIGHDEERGDELRPIEFARIAGGKPFDITQHWYLDLLGGDRAGRPVAAPPADH